MRAVDFDFTIDAGSDHSDGWEFLDVNENPFDFTGWTARMALKKTRYDTVPQELFTTENGGLVIDGEAGRIALIIPHEKTSEMAATYVYDLELIDTEGTVMRMLQGYLTVSPEVTR